MNQPTENSVAQRPKWRMPVFEELDIADGTEGNLGDDGLSPGGGDDFISS